MDINFFIDKLFIVATKKGLKDFEVYYAQGESFSVKIYNGSVDDYKNSSGTGLSFRGIYQEKMGYSYTENFSDDSIELLVNELIANATVLESVDKEFIYQGAKNYDKRDNYSGLLESIKTSDKIDAAIKMESSAKRYDKRVHSVNYCIYGEGTGKRIIRNSNGINLTDSYDGAHAYINVVIKDGDQTKTGYSLKSFKDFKDFKPEDLSKEAVERALSLLGSHSVPSGKYDVIIKNEAFVDLLESMGGIFSAEAIDKGMSKLKDKIGDKIASEKITLIDDPIINTGIWKTFDDEGVPTQKKTLIEKGILKTYLHSLKTAHKFGVEPTGNGQKASYKSSVVIGTYNFYIEPGEVSFNELLETMKNGLVLIEFDGLHAGLNSISGDFSLSTRGYIVKNGKISGAVNEITLAANYFDLLLNLEEIGADLKFSYPFGNGGSPSILFRNLDIAGE